jgi:hypothetical protein
MVERSLPGFTTEQLPAAAGAAKSATVEMAAEGTPIRYLRSTFVPSEQKCYCLFEGESPVEVEQAQARAGLPFDRIYEAELITADDV